MYKASKNNQHSNRIFSNTIRCISTRGTSSPPKYTNRGKCKGKKSNTPQHEYQRCKSKKCDCTGAEVEKYPKSKPSHNVDLISSYGLCRDQDIFNLNSNDLFLVPNLLTGKQPKIFNTCTRVKFDDRFINQKCSNFNDKSYACTKCTCGNCCHPTDKCCYVFDESKYGYKILKEGVYEISAKINLFLEFSTNIPSGGEPTYLRGPDGDGGSEELRRNIPGFNVINGARASVTISKCNCFGTITALQQSMIYANLENLIQFKDPNDSDKIMAGLQFNEAIFNFNVETGCGKRNVEIGDMIIVTVSLLDIANVGPPENEGGGVEFKGVRATDSNRVRFYITGERSSCGGTAPTSMFNVKRIACCS
jgi:hypothetical protein